MRPTIPGRGLRRVRSFTQIIQDNQFSAMGLVLLAELSNIARLIGIDLGQEEAGRSKNLPETKIEDLEDLEDLEDIGEAVRRPMFQRFHSRLDSSAVDDILDACDSGFRDLASSPGQDRVQSTNASPSRLVFQGEADSTAPRRRDVRQRAKTGSHRRSKFHRGQKTGPGNTIDELFSGLN